MLFRFVLLVGVITVPLTTLMAQTSPAAKLPLLLRVQENLPAPISKVLVIEGVNETGKEVVARLLVSAPEFDKMLRAEPNVIPDMFWPVGRHVGPHKHAWKSLRTKGTHQSLQYTIYRAPAGDYVEMDIDRDCPQWDDPVSTAKHLALQIVPNWVSSKILRSKPASSIAKSDEPMKAAGQK